MPSGICTLTQLEDRAAKKSETQYELFIARFASQGALCFVRLADAS